MCECLECVVPDANLALQETRDWMDAHVRLETIAGVEQLVVLCPPGAARHCMDLRNRGLDLPLEVTCWPKQKRYNLTTGLDDHRDFVWAGNMKDREYQAVADRLEIGLDHAAEWVE